MTEANGEGSRRLRLTLPMGEVEGTPEELAAFVRLLEKPAGPVTIPVNRPIPPARPNNDELLVQYAGEMRHSKETRATYVRAVAEFERGIHPRSFLDATTDDARAFETRLVTVCRHRKWNYLNGKTGVNHVPQHKCAKGEYDWTLTPPASCATTCPLFQRQTSGPNGKLKALSDFYGWLEYRGLSTTNIATPVRKHHARGLGPRTDRGKYAPRLDEVRSIIRALSSAMGPREVALVLVLAKTGRRPGHVVMLHARDVDVKSPVATVSFKSVLADVLRENDSLRSKLCAGLVNVLDAETRAHLRDVYFPYRQKRWGYAWNEGPLFPGRNTGTTLSDANVQPYILDVAMTWLRDNASSDEERAAWTDHLALESPRRITPGCFRHYFTTQAKKDGVQNDDIDLLRGDKIQASRAAYMDLHAEDLAPLYPNAPRLLPS